MEKGISLKKGLLIIWSLLCTVSACAIGYATPYKGSAHSGYIHTSAPVRSSRSTMGLAQAPMASMSTTSSMSRGISYNEPSSTPAVQGIYTSASQISGGVTAAQVYTSGGVMKRKVGPGGNPGDCDCDWQWNATLNLWECTKCGSTETDEDYFDENHHHGGDCPCYVPLSGGWEVWLFMTALAAAYAVYKKRTQTV